MAKTKSEKGMTARLAGEEALRLTIQSQVLRRFPPKGRIAKAFYCLRRAGIPLTVSNLTVELREDLNSTVVKGPALELVWKTLEPLLLASYRKELLKRYDGDNLLPDPDVKPDPEVDTMEEDCWRDLGDAAGA